jgi:hypothetical protein
VTYRDDVRQKQAELAAAAKDLGINVDDIRKETRHTGGVAAQIIRAVNEPTPTEGHERIFADDFADGVFNGTNQEYQLSRRILGQNLLVWHVVQASGSIQRLEKTSNPAPSAGQFFFDDLFTIRVGTAPATLDSLVAAGVTTL